MELLCMLAALCTCAPGVEPRELFTKCWWTFSFEKEIPQSYPSSHPTAKNHQVQLCSPLEIYLTGHVLLTYIIYSVEGLSGPCVFLLLPITLLCPPLLCACLPWSRPTQGVKLKEADYWPSRNPQDRFLEKGNNHVLSACCDPSILCMWPSTLS